MAAKKPRTTSKAIAETIAGASAGAGKAAQSSSVVGRSAMFKALSPRQAFEQDITVRTAVLAYAEQPAKCQRRLFSRRTGQEIVSGAAVEFIRRHVTPQFIRDVTHWRLIEGERMVWKCPGVDGVPQKLVIMDPGYCRAMPYQMNHLDLLENWQYFQPYVLSGVLSNVTLPVAEVMFSKNFNPNSNVRGLSPLVTGALHASTNYYSNRFNASYFQNSAHRDLVMRFPKGTPDKTAQDFVDRWQANHGIWQNNGFKISAIIGDQFEIMQPGSENSNRDGQFLQLKQQNSEEMAGLLGVPALIMGNYARVRYDTSAAEQESFFENRILPEVLEFSEWIQRTLVDPHFSLMSPAGKKSTPKFISRRMSDEFTRAMDEHPDGDYIFVLDPDHLPIAARLRASHLDIADKYRRTAGATFSEACEWAGVDRVSNVADDLIYIDGSQQRVDPTDPSVIPTMPIAGPGPAAGKPGPAAPAGTAPVPESHVDPDAVPADAPDEGDDEDGSEVPPAGTDAKTKSASLAKLTAFASAYRSLVLDAAAGAGGIYSKQAALALARDLGESAAPVELAIHREFLVLRELVKSTPDATKRMAALKKHLNSSWKKSALKTLI